MRKQTKKGFTIVELVIVIALIAILAAVLIPTFSNVINNAHESSDTMMVKNLNTILNAEEVNGNRAANMTEALKQAEEGGYKVDKLTPTSSGDIVWDQASNRFVLINAKKEVVYKDESVTEVDLTNGAYKLWKITSDIDTDRSKGAGYSWYLADGYKGSKTINAATGIDVGKNEDIVVLNYTNTSSAERTILLRTNSAETVMTVDAGTDEVSHYGAVKEVNIVRVKMGTYTEYGAVAGNINLAKGKVKVADGAEVANVIIKSLTTSDEVTVAPESNEEVAVVVEQKAKVATIASNLDNITVNEIAGGSGAENVAKIEKNDTNVAYVGAQGYENFALAVRGAGNNSTIVLTKDVTVSGYLTFEKVAVTIDLNGHNISSNGIDLFIKVQSGANLTIKNSQETENKITSNVGVIGIGNEVDESYKAVVTIGKNICIEGGTVSSTTAHPAVFIGAGSELNVYGTIFGVNNPAIQGNGLSNTAKRSTKINLYNGALVKSGKLAIYHPQLGELNIDGATVEGYAAIGIKSGTLNIVNGAVVRGVKNDSVLGDKDSDTGKISYDGSAIVIDSYVGYAGNMNITVKDATVESLYSYAIKEIKKSDAGSTNIVSLKISGNSVVNSNNPDTTTGDVYVKNASTILISGGSFSKEVYSAYIENGYKAEKSGNVWVVKAK